MRIVSKFRDYYDSVIQYGTDDEITYIRETTYQDGFFPSYSPFDRESGLLIGFAGKVYPIVWHAGNTIQPSCLYKTIYEWHEHVIDMEKSKKYWQQKISKYDLNRDVNHYNELIAGDYSTLFSRAPIWMTEGNCYGGRYMNRLTLNPCLRGFDFAKILDPYTAFQNLRMWLSAQAHPEPPIPHIDDKTMAEAKGFNKWSFRKEPSKARK